MKEQKILFVALIMHGCLVSGMFRLNSLMLQPIKKYSAICTPLASHQRKLMNETIAQELLKAKKSVSLAMYSFNRKELAYILAYLKNEKKVKLRVILDRHSTIGTCNIENFLKKLGVRSIVYSFADKLMHHKLAVIDGKTVILGSYNYSEPAAQRNRESAIILRGTGVARYYEKEISDIVKEIKDRKKSNNIINKILQRQMRLKMKGYRSFVTDCNQKNRI